MWRAALLKNVQQILKRGLCVGCGTCAFACPYKAIKIAKDETKGFYVPVISEEECRNCGVCMKVCYGTKPASEQYLIESCLQNLVIGDFPTSYVGYACDWNLRYNSSSGGVISAICLYLLEKGIVDGVLVTGMARKNPLEPVSFVATKKSEILSAGGSKYCPVPLGIALENIAKGKGTYAIVGLPCHIYGARKAEDVYPDLAIKIKFHLGIFCSGTPTFLATEYLLRKLKLQKKQVLAIEYRGGGWPGRMKIELKGSCIDRSSVQMPYPKYWEGIVGLFHIHGCTLCNDEFNRLADVSCGDAWLPEFRNDNLGTSIVITRNEIGEELIDQACKNGYIEMKRTDHLLENEQAQKLLKKLHTRIYLQKALGRSLPPWASTCTPAYRESHSTTLKEFIYLISVGLQRIIASKRQLWCLLDLDLLARRIVKKRRSTV